MSDIFQVYLGTMVIMILPKSDFITHSDNISCVTCYTDMNSHVTCSLKCRFLFIMYLRGFPINYILLDIRILFSCRCVVLLYAHCQQLLKKSGMVFGSLIPWPQGTGLSMFFTAKTSCLTMTVFHLQQMLQIFLVQYFCSCCCWSCVKLEVVW